MIAPRQRAENPFGRIGVTTRMGGGAVSDIIKVVFAKTRGRRTLLLCPSRLGIHRRLLSIFSENQIMAVRGYVIGPRRPETETEKRLLQGFLVASGIVLLALVIYYFLNPRAVIGDAFVNGASGAPAEIPPPGTFPFYVKPITILLVSGIVFSYCFFSLIQNFLRARIPRAARALLLVVSVVLLGMGIYEVLFNFSLWGALMLSGAPPGSLVNPYPISSSKTNLVYATKITVLWVLAALFAASAFKSSLKE
jgi:hypothetical protein